MAFRTLSSFQFREINRMPRNRINGIWDIDLKYTNKKTSKTLEPARIIPIYTEKYFRNLIKSYLNQIVITIFRLIWNQTKRTSVWIQINRKMVNTIWFRFDLISFGRFLCVHKGYSAAVLREILYQKKMTRLRVVIAIQLNCYCNQVLFFDKESSLLFSRIEIVNLRGYQGLVWTSWFR